MCEIRCSSCKAVLCEIEHGILIIKGKATIEVQPQSRVKAKCKCGKLNFINPARDQKEPEPNIYSGSRGIVVL